MKTLKNYIQPCLKVVLLNDDDLICTSNTSSNISKNSNGVKASLFQVEDYDDADFD